jgi:hypothetical protein
MAGLEERLARAIESAIRGSGEYIGGVNDGGSFYVDGDIVPAELARVVLEELALTEECGYGDVGEESPDGWFSAADGVEDSRAAAVQAARGRALFSRWVSPWLGVTDQ